MNGPSGCEGAPRGLTVFGTATDSAEEPLVLERRGEYNEGSASVRVAGDVTLILKSGISRFGEFFIKPVDECALVFVASCVLRERRTFMG